jgi:hypothetical protein
MSTLAQWGCPAVILAFAGWLALLIREIRDRETGRGPKRRRYPRA